MGIAPDSRGYLDGEYHQEESKELEDTGGCGERDSSKPVSNTKGCRTVSMRVAQTNRPEEGDSKAESPWNSGGKCDPLP